MKKILALLLAAIVVFAACNKSEVTDESNLAPITERKCYSMEVLEQQIMADPARKQKLDEIEAFTERYIHNPSAYRILADGVTLEVPVVVNVLWNTAAENIADAQIQSQITVLNEDFGGTNADHNLTSTYQSVKAGDIKIRFVLQNTVRKQTSVTSWSTNDAMKKSSQGGIDPTSPATTLNLWACTMGGGILGYAQFPGGNAATDGVVILNTAFGSRSKYPGGYYISTYDLGRTATHEVGHYFNLRHIWGDTRCGNDFVSDTPLHDAANYGCPAAGHKSRCSGKPVEMTMNYMDYTDDACMYMFSNGQGVRMQATYAVGGPRASLR